MSTANQIETSRQITDYVGKKRIDAYDVVVGTILTLWAFIIIFPFFNVIALSFATDKEYLQTPYMFFPLQPTLKNYAQLMLDKRIIIGYRTTLMYVLLGVPYNMFLTICTSFALSKDYFPGKKFFMLTILFTMYFSGGIVPLYLLVKNLQLTDTIWAIILLYGCNTFYMIVMRNYFLAIPAAMQESARIDGAGEWRILFSIMLPLSLPILATFSLFFTVDRWNEWFNSMIFIKNPQITPLQLVLRSIIMTAQFSQLQDAAGSASEMATRFAKGMKMCAVIVTMAPIMLAYPFVQRYFVKGIMIGAIKA